MCSEQKKENLWIKINIKVKRIICAKFVLKLSEIKNVNAMFNPELLGNLGYVWFTLI